MLERICIVRASKDSSIRGDVCEGLVWITLDSSGSMGAQLCGG